MATGTVFACLSTSGPLYGKDKEEIFIHVGEYKLTSVTSADGQMGMACFYKGNKRIDCSKDPFFLLRQCEDKAMRQALMREYARKEVSEGGGVEEYQKGIDANIKRFGADFYNYMDPEAKRIHSEAGLRFEGSAKITKDSKD